MTTVNLTHQSIHCYIQYDFFFTMIPGKLYATCASDHFRIHLWVGEEGKAAGCTACILYTQIHEPTVKSLCLSNSTNMHELFTYKKL